MVLIAASVFVTDKYQPRCAYSETSHTQQDQHDKTAFPLDGFGSHPNAPHPAKDIQQGKNDIPWWYILIAWPSGITTLAIIATLFVIGWQAVETRRAAEAMQLGNRATIDSQRARILILHHYSDLPTGNRTERDFQFMAKNVGQTVAEVFEICERLDHFSIEEFKNIETITFPAPKKAQMIAPHVIFGGDQWQIGLAHSWVVVPPEMKYDIEAGKVFPTWHGWIKYRDFVGKEHKRGFCYMYSFKNRTFYPAELTGKNKEEY